jgi:uncharacterized protein YjbJ (UPF0337 family)
MRPSIENEVAGKVHEVKGAIKGKVGHVTNNPNLESEGAGENLAGKIQNKIGQVQKVVEKPKVRTVLDNSNFEGLSIRMGWSSS